MHWNRTGAVANSIEVQQEGGRYIARASFQQKDLVKQAGFRWDPDRRHWWTADPLIAAKLGSTGELQRAIAEREEKRIASIAGSRAADADIDVPVPEGLAYLPYQRAGIAFGLDHESVLLGDDMGLGKTIQVIGIMNADATLKRTLILCPASLKLNWAIELRKWLTRPLTIEIAAKKYLPSSDIVIVNYDQLKKYRAAIEKVKWDLLVADEAHYLKNPKAQRTQFVVGKEAQPRKGVDGVPGIAARRRLMLTGTPIPNRPVEGWPIFRYLDPITFNNFFKFAIRYCNGHQNDHGWDFSGASNLAELQDKLRSTIMIRRKKMDVLTELPPKRRQVVELEMDDAMRGVIQEENDTWEEHEAEIGDARVAVELAKAGTDGEYETAVSNLRSLTRAAFSQLSKLRHDTAVAKAPLVIEHLRDMIDQGMKVVCFAHHKDVIHLILEAFPDISVSITGDTPMHRRQEAVERFQADANCLLFVGNIQAAGVGLTLTAASNVVFAELDWVPGNVTQAEDRCHRIGQHDVVFVQHLVLDGSLDCKIAKTLVVKQEIIDQALDRVRAIGEAAPAIPTTDRERGSTEAMTREQVFESAKVITSLEQIEAIHEGLQMIAGMCDGAREQDGAGFNKIDSAIGRSLAGCLVLSNKQAALGLKLVTKYKRQIPASLLARAKG